MAFSYTRSREYLLERAGRARGGTIVRTEERGGTFPVFYLMLETDRFLGEVRVYSAVDGRGFARMDVAELPPGERMEVRDQVELLGDDASGFAWFFQFFPEDAG